MRAWYALPLVALLGCPGPSPDPDPACDDEVDGTWWYRDADGDGFGDPDEAVRACVQPEGYVDNDLDCDDTDPHVHPDAPERCDGKDTNCNGEVDDVTAMADPPVWYRDADGDGYGDPDDAVQACEQPEGYVDNDLDCAPGNPDLPTWWWPDGDEDGWGDPDADPLLDCDQPPGHVANDLDCDDTDPAVGPPTAWWPDGDEDGYGDMHAEAVYACEQPEGHVDNDLDCDDTDASVGPPTPWWPDADGDGFGDMDADPLYACEQPVGYVDNDLDCDDTDASIFPGAPEIAGDGIDQDCSGYDLPQVDYGHTQWPCAAEIDAGGSATYYGWVYMAGLTDAALYPDPDADLTITAQLGYGPQGTDPNEGGWIWVDGAFHERKPGLAGPDENAEYEATLEGVPGGTWDVAWRFTTDGGMSWLLADLGPACEDAGGVPGQGSEDGYNLPATLEVGVMDCPDDHPTVYPGAPELCDGQPNDCDTAASWTPAAEAGTVSLQRADGSWEDLTALFEAGSDASPVDYTVGEGDTLWICEGSFYAHLVVDGPDAAIRGRHGAEVTVVSGAGLGSVITFDEGSSGAVHGLTLTDGHGAPQGGGILFSGTTLLVQDAVLLQNHAERFGGGLYMAGGEVTVVDTDFLGNTGGGDTNTWGGGGLYQNGGELTVTGANFIGNEVFNRGAGLSQGAGTATVSNSLFEDNICHKTTTGGRGGGLAVRGDLDLVDSVVRDNEAHAGGGVGVLGFGNVRLFDTVIEGNHARLQGGAFHLIQDARVGVLAGSRVHGNTSESRGGATYLQERTHFSCFVGLVGDNGADEGGGVYMTGTSTLFSEDCAWQHEGNANSPEDIFVVGAGAYWGDTSEFTCSADGGSGCLFPE